MLRFEQIQEIVLLKAKKIGFSEPIIRRAAELSLLIKHKTGHRGAMTAAALYVASKEKGEFITQRIIRDEFGFSEVTLRRHIKAINEEKEKSLYNIKIPLI